jgi:hypothetical protein
LNALFGLNYLALGGVCCYDSYWGVQRKDVVNTKLFLPPFFVLVFFVFSTISTRSQTVITFDNIPLNNGSSEFLANDYQGLVWSNFGIVNGILQHNNGPFFTNGFYYGLVSDSNLVGNAVGNPAEVDSPSNNFNFLSAYLTGAWRSNLNIEVQGFNGVTLLYDTTVVVNATSPILFTFDYQNINRLDFSSTGGQAAFSFDGGSNFVMDNFTFEFVPEPSTFLLAAVGALMLWPFLKRKRV